MKTNPDLYSQPALINWHIWSIVVCTAALVGLTGFTLHLDGVDALLSGHPAKQSAPASTGESAEATGTDGSDVSIPDASPAMKCAQCGVVSSLREVVEVATETESHSPQRSTRKIVEVTVQLRNGSQHVFREIGSSIWRVGERMIVVGGV